MKIISAITIAMMLSVGVSSAAEVKEKGGYAGAAIGSAKYDNDKIDRFESQGVSTEKTYTGFQLWGGYKFSKHFALEGRASALGNYKIRYQDGEASARYGSLSAHAVGIIPFGDSGWDVYGQAGLGLITQSAKTNAGTSGDDSYLGGAAGLGVRWTFMPQLTVSAGVDVWFWEDSFVDDTKTDASVLMSRLGLQYNF